MAQVEGLKVIKKRLESIRHRYGKGKTGVIVGYRGVNYALYVHESWQMEQSRKKRPGKNPKAQWKFLEQPARELRDEFIKIISLALKSGLTVSDALYLAGLRLQRASEDIVPVKLGNLKGSAFTERENVG